jgi:hypothetical protein
MTASKMISGRNVLLLDLSGADPDPLAHINLLKPVAGDSGITVSLRHKNHHRNIHTMVAMFSAEEIQRKSGANPILISFQSLPANNQQSSQIESSHKSNKQLQFFSSKITHNRIANKLVNFYKNNFFCN